jgi:hypothetical protein
MPLFSRRRRLRVIVPHFLDPISVIRPIRLVTAA